MKKWATSLVKAGKGIPEDRRIVLRKNLQEDLEFLMQNMDNIPDIIKEFVSAKPGEMNEEDENNKLVLKWCQELQTKKLSNKEK